MMPESDSNSPEQKAHICLNTIVYKTQTIKSLLGRWSFNILTKTSKLQRDK